MIRLKWSKFTLKLGTNLIMPHLLRWSTITILMAYCKAAVSSVGLQWRYHPQSCTKPLPYATSATAIFCYELLDIFFLPYPQSLLWTEFVLISIQKNCNNCICTVRLLYKRTSIILFTFLMQKYKFLMITAHQNRSISHNVSDKYPTMHHFLHMHISVAKIVSALWDMGLVHCGICATDLLHITQQWHKEDIERTKDNNIKICDVYWREKVIWCHNETPMPAVWVGENLILLNVPKFWIMTMLINRFMHMTCMSNHIDMWSPEFKQTNKTWNSL